MKVELEFNVGVDGKPEIVFRHHDKDESLDQRLLGVFVKMAHEHGLDILNPRGFLESGTNKSWEEFKIVTR